MWRSSIVIVEVSEGQTFGFLPCDTGDVLSLLGSDLASVLFEDSLDGGQRLLRFAQGSPQLGHHTELGRLPCRPEPQQRITVVNLK